MLYVPAPDAITLAVETACLCKTMVRLRKSQHIASTHVVLLAKIQTHLVAEYNLYRMPSNLVEHNTIPEGSVSQTVGRAPLSGRVNPTRGTRAY
ncbi:hypothetical protein TNCV_664301 [Trichonephila clavipes]|nr:hypothetical protein TNCV_664301 [Trichonephila clavipes]